MNMSFVDTPDLRDVPEVGTTLPRVTRVITQRNSLPRSFRGSATNLGTPF
jgi:hypothetical protein